MDKDEAMERLKLAMSKVPADRMGAIGRAAAADDAEGALLVILGLISEVDPKLAYNEYLRAHGMDGANPWHTWANAGVDENGDIASGWYYRNAHRPTRAPDEHGETAYMTRRAMDFMREAGDQPWVAHLSFIKPHWPYVVPAPYAGMYTPEVFGRSVGGTVEIK